MFFENICGKICIVLNKLLSLWHKSKTTFAMERLHFTKMHGAGNDYIYINGIESCPNNLGELSERLSDRHKGIGSDGLVVILSSEVADFKMRMFNADGSEGKMCGNASRCIGKYVYDKGLTRKTIVSLETLSGIKVLKLHIAEDGKVGSVTVDMGEPGLEPSAIPVLSKTIKAIPVSVKGVDLEITAVSMGNPHGVIFCDNPDCVDIHGIGVEIENLPIFPERVNVEFVSVLNANELQMRVWERGSGETMACGTGACASLVAAVLNGECKRNATIHLLGGDLQIEWASDNHVYMTGPAEIAFEGTVLI